MARKTNKQRRALALRFGPDPRIAKLESEDFREWCKKRSLSLNQGLKEALREVGAIRRTYDRAAS